MYILVYTRVSVCVGARYSYIRTNGQFADVFRINKKIKF